MRALPTKRLLRGRFSAAFLLVAFALLSTACVERFSPDGVPAVPPGFGDQMPDVPLSGYIYITPPSSEETIGIDALLLGTDGSDLAWQSDLRSISLWISPVDRASQTIAVTARFEFQNEGSALAAQSVIEQADAVAETWVHRDGLELDWVFGRGVHADGMRKVVAADLFVSKGEVTNSVMWKSARALPQAPHRPVLAAGFVALPPAHMKELFGWLADQAAIDLRLLGDALVRVNADNAVFAFYGDALPVLSNDLTLKEITDNGVAGLVIARTEMPSPLVSWGFNVGALRAGMQRLEIDSGRAYGRELDGAVVMAQVRRGDIQIAVASSQTEAESVLNLIPS